MGAVKTMMTRSLNCLTLSPPALEAMRRITVAGDAIRDGPSTTGQRKTRRKQALLKSSSGHNAGVGQPSSRGGFPGPGVNEDIAPVGIAGGCEGLAAAAHGHCWRTLAVLASVLGACVNAWPFAAPV